MAGQSQSYVSKGAGAVEGVSNRTGLSEARIMGTVRVIGGAMIGIAILALVLTEVFTLEAMDIQEGPFSGVVDSLESTGGAALGLLVIGLLVAAANRVMGFFGSGGF
ncbi:uncharacterized protein NP_7014A (plasmid) [Natronomonas pharaonis DSM 2160]|uniref:Uncharacterized protein n=1 Tax=Natronomonas pharaonis (strain ATCC 35678 / DSM 2160 / CIP 103997 / JCM 8858 / NBRC 14720 / NCIMB 2260 / Gabara) TaxID=348780 RepID=Q3ILU7_NATPD|nr:hypothetical protein [Natronomonas pharaonis]CAI49736.1 uncharacterized protein NP_3290A [Natronomonas pharaonis DSM 2160]CAI50923.1 uncharacterized protein NP_7014A [Natronomonas pharaonis DSM 2160]